MSRRRNGEDGSWRRGGQGGAEDREGWRREGRGERIVEDRGDEGVKM